MSQSSFFSRFKSFLNFFGTTDNVEQSTTPSPSEIKGEESEEKIFHIITEMMVWKELPTRKRGTQPYRTDKWSKLDLEGVDIVVPTKRGDIYIQVKSSRFGWSQFVRDRRNTAIVCINAQKDEVTILKELRHKIRIAYERLGDHP